jgi:hypothetical protein
LPDGVDGGSVQQRYRAQNAQIFDTPFTVYDRFEDDDAVHLRSERERWVFGLDAFN